MKYIDVFSSHNEYISNKWSHYLFIYEELISQYIKNNTPINILEIGVQNGGSLQIWEKYLPEGSQVYGIDLNEKCKNLSFSDNIHFLLGDATDSDFLNRELNNIKFDIIIDDGSHINKDVIKTFETLFIDKLNNGGLYIVEDMHTSYWKNFYGGGFKKKNTMIEFFKDCIDALNAPYLPRPKFFQRKHYKKLKELNKYIKQIRFYDSVCAIEKFEKTKTLDNFGICTRGTADIEDAVLLQPNITNTETFEKVEQIKELYSKE